MILYHPCRILSGCLFLLFLFQGPVFAGEPIHRFSFPSTVALSGADTVLATQISPISSLDRIDTLGPGRVVVRKREGNDSYALFCASVDPRAFPRGRLRWFTRPAHISVQDAFSIRFYSSQNFDSDQDLRIVMFDKHRMYADAENLWFEFDSTVLSLSGRHSPLRGSIRCSSVPSGAKVVVQGKSTGLSTPCEIPDLFPGNYEVEVWHPDYRFLAKPVEVYSDSVVDISFSLFSDMDTVYVHGRSVHGLLIMPRPPHGTPFLLNGDTLRQQEILLEAGTHMIKWSKGPAFESLDTIITIVSGRAQYFFFQPKARVGWVRLERYPDNLTLTINNRIVPASDSVFEMEAGVHRFRAFARGYHEQSDTISIPSDTESLLRIVLIEITDRDQDGFPDSVDRCPDVYGLYQGCPNPQTTSAIRTKFREVLDTMRNDPLGIGVVMFGFMSRTAVNGRMRRLLSSFDDGKHALDNYRGLTIANTVTAHFRGFFASVELGQWMSGLEYRREDTLRIPASGGHHLVVYDSLLGIFPTIFLPSTALSAGVHFGIQWFNISYGIGRQWEDIVFTDILSPNNEVITAILDNDFWFHHLCADVEYRVAGLISPSVFWSMKVPFGKVRTTQWNSMMVGVQIRFYPMPRPSRITR